MTELLLEIYGEEIPPHFQHEGKEKIKEAFRNFLNEKKINYNEINAFATARRFVIVINGLPINTQESRELVRGPITSANQNAIDGFLRSKKISDITLLKKKIINTKEYFFFEKILPKTPIKEILEISIPEILSSIRWSKSMVWVSRKIRWIRPIKHIFCIFNKENISINFEGIESSNYFYGNYQYGNTKLKCNSFKEYEDKLEENYVVLKEEIRRKRIDKLLTRYKAQNYEIIFDKSTINSVEFPTLHIGSFDKSYLKLPTNFLIAVISGKQNYFSFKKKNNNQNRIENIFGYISNKKENNIIKKDFEKVLNSRFLDTIYFLNSDIKIGLEQYYNKLGGLKYFEGLGNLRQKSERINNLCKFIAKFLYSKILINNNGELKFNEIKYAKADLVSNLVQEFPELQGDVGSHLLELNKSSKEVCLAIREQYLPNTLNDKCPKEPLSICLSIADKIDHLVGIFLIGKKPTGSKDPFALRRSAFGLIRIIIENKLDIDLNRIISFAEEVYLHQKNNLNKNLVNKNLNALNITESKKSEINEYFSQRLVYYLKDKFSQEKIYSILDTKDELRPYYIFQKVKKLEDYLSQKDSQNFLKAYKRINSILIETPQNASINKSLIKKKEEMVLFNRILEMKNLLMNQKEKNISEFSENLILLNKFSSLIDNFFDKVQVNSSDKKLKDNRLNILLMCKKIFQEICNFSKILNTK